MKWKYWHIFNLCLHRITLQDNWITKIPTVSKYYVWNICGISWESSESHKNPEIWIFELKSWFSTQNWRRMKSYLTPHVLWKSSETEPQCGTVPELLNIFGRNLKLNPSIYFAYKKCVNHTCERFTHLLFGESRGHSKTTSPEFRGRGGGRGSNRWRTMTKEGGGTSTAK